MSQPARITDFASFIPPTAHNGQAPQVRLVVPPEHLLPICAICSRKGYEHRVEANPDGSLTGLCATHGRFERELRRALMDAGRNGAMTPELAKSVRADVVTRFTAGRR